ncbi:MAG: 1,4-alpha-glucan branching protein GlgB [Eubacteriales bacterium]|nr:1,4-alpha-glucan branching protein GlgB [Eubacteriales bacterium]
MNFQDFYDGRAFDAHTFFGAHPTPDGVWFRTYAPAAQRVAVLGEFSAWQPLEMPQQAQSGVFSLLCPDARPGQLYQYAITGADGRTVEHCDPYGFGMELRPAHASVVVDLSGYSFTDDVWMAQRTKNFDTPVNIYEMHLGSWRTNPDSADGLYRYDEIAPVLIAYLKENGYTHVEFLPLAEHPVDESWGYQTTGFFSPTARYGTAGELMHLVDLCHRSGIGVIMDFVPVHFALDDYGLKQYDGTALYEYPSGDVGQSEWGTCNFIYSRREVCCFLQSCAHYWLSQYHLDGLRMDAISRAIYWQGDPNRGVNELSIAFLRTMNDGLQRLHPTAMLIAEDSTSYPKVTEPVQAGGLGFDYKWDLGWMNDTLEYFRTPPFARPGCYHKLTFSIFYFYNEHFLLPFSHDEVVHGTATIAQKMWGQYEDKFPQVRALYLYLYTHPGKKLDFMGNEFAQLREWDEKREQDWDMLQYPLHDSFRAFRRQLHLLYLSCPALHEKEYDRDSFRWVEANAPDKSVYAYERRAGGQRMLAVFNFSDMDWDGHGLPFDQPVRLTERLNSDWDVYSGRTPKKPASFVSTEDPETGLHWVVLPLNRFSGRLFELKEL